MTHPLRTLGVVAACSIALLGPPRALAEGRTARADLPRVLEKARLWQPDAALVHLASARVGAGGLAPEWKYSFYSPRTGRRCVVTARGENVTVKVVRLGNFTQPLGAFVDSDKAMEVAARNGLKGAEPSMSVLRPAGAPAGGTRWLVSGGWNPGDTSISLDAATGAFLGRSVIGKD